MSDNKIPSTGKSFKVKLNEKDFGPDSLQPDWVNEISKDITAELIRRMRIITAARRLQEAGRISQERCNGIVELVLGHSGDVTVAQEIINNHHEERGLRKAQQSDTGPHQTPEQSKSAECEE